jgi:N utilization substance protein B
VQAIYARGMIDGEVDLAALLASVLSRLEQLSSAEGHNIPSPHANFLKKLTELVLLHSIELDQIIEANLAINWNLNKLNTVTKAILRAAIAELKFMEEIPAKAIIDEYTTIAASFFDSSETGFVNSILDKISTRLRG